MTSPPIPELTPGRRAVLTRYGSEPLAAHREHLVLETQPPPDPAALAPTDVLIAVRAAAVGWVDLLMASGHYQHTIQPPYTPGLEYSGVVAWAGPEAKAVQVGDPVIADPFLTGPRSKGDHAKWGGFASWAVAPAEAVIPLPGPLSFEQGACLLGAYETAHHVLVACGRLRAGETVLIHGASGSTGLAAVHLAKRLGATVIATGRSAEKLQVVAAEGADHLVCTAGDGARFRERVKELTGGRGVDVVWDGVGGPASEESLRCVRFGARFLIVGWAATPLAKAKPNQLPTNLILIKGLEVRGCPTAIATHHDPSIRAARLQQVLAWAEAGSITPRVHRAYALDEVLDALRDKWSAQAVGNLVLSPP